MLATIGHMMPRIRKIRIDGPSTVIILNVDQMPGARPPRPSTASVSYNVSWIDYLYTFLRSFIFVT